MRVIDILKNENRIRKYDFYEDFMASPYFDMLVDTYQTLNEDILYDSKVHGKAHIERVIFFTLLLSFAYDLDEADTDILRDAASLHDTMRVNDGWDTDHGRRAATRNIKYARTKKKDQNILQAVITAHSINDKLMDDIIREFVKDESKWPRATRLAKLFKDSDGLDRVRINRLDPSYLRNDYSRKLVDFAYEFYENF
ncbi:hypothetical protein [Anaerococcus sp. AGMB09787]|uniref:hypothetical protein n=1 Tax=Anaerococcus sp. AGMB09787 TaxID=2922869 RepID=UPI001FAF7650|nr:hypothetical protein [Anaerococcus sp. AGMB09787]